MEFCYNQLQYTVYIFYVPINNYTLDFDYFFFVF